jgi:uncharacterized membrane-anchored protein YhcB (DUF1043 family)
MKKPLLLIVGLVFGFLLAEIVRRPKMKRLQVLEAKATESNAQYAEYNKEWQRQFANMPFAERMDWELFEASLKLDGHIKDDDNEQA